MRSVNKSIRSVLILILVCAMLTTFASAAGEDSLWFKTMESDTDTLSAWIVTDATVTDGMVELTYDSETMTYAGTEVNGDYVAVHAVNAEEPGIVRIAWVAPGEYEADKSHWLLCVTFTGTGSVSVSGSIASGTDADLPKLDTSELEKAILEAEGLYEDDYTVISYKALKKALAMAREVLADPAATQSQVDAAAETLYNGIASLHLKLITNNSELYKAILRAQGLRKHWYTEESWAALEEALANAKAVKNDRNATQKQVDEATQALNDAMDNLVLKCESEETQPTETTEPEETEPSNPEETEPSKPEGDKDSWFDHLKDWFDHWFKPGEPEQTEPEETTEPAETEPVETTEPDETTEPEETTAPDASVPETSEPAEQPENPVGSWLRKWLEKWFGGWFGWGK